MRFRICSVVALAAAGGLGVVEGAERESGLEELRWRTDLEASRKVALEQGKPLLAVFR